MTNIIYLHGFNSAFNPDNEKVLALSALGNVVGINYNSYDTYKNIYNHLSKELQNCDLDDTVIVGTSLGGFWAAEMAFKFSVPSVIVNPCYDPFNMLRKYNGLQTNYATGETVEFSDTIPQSYMHRKSYDSVYKILPLVLLDMGDEVIDSFETRRLFEGFPMVCYVDGSHRFDHMKSALEEITEYVNYSLFVDHMDF